MARRATEATEAADIACGVVGYVALWWRRRWPLAFAGYILLVSVFSTLVGGLPFVAAFTVAVHRNWPTALVTSALLALAAWPSVILYTGGGTRNVGVLMVVVTVLMFAATGWGMFIRARRQLLASLRGWAERAERSREEHARHARIAERQRIAREMHDVLAHRLSLLSVQVELAAVPADTGRTLYRIVQEGLTNARKHAPGSMVEVTMDGAPERGLSVTVTSWLPVDRPPPGDGAGPGGAGTGLIGLRERAALAGGHVEAAVTGDDRFRLSAWLPWAGR